MNRSHIAAALLLAGAFLSTHAGAVALTIPGDYPIAGTTAALRPELAGTVLADTLSNFTMSTGSDTISGTIQSRVVRETGTGTLDFYWRVTPTEGSAAISAFRVGGFGDNALDADWRIDGLGSVAPSNAHYFGASGSLAGYVNFLFDSQVLTANDSSYFMFLHTNATSYSMDGIMDVADAGTVHASELLPTYVPSVPVPAAAWLFGSGLTGMIGIARRKK